MAKEKEDSKAATEDTTKVFAIVDIKGYDVKAGEIFDMETKFVRDAVEAGKVRKLTSKESAKKAPAAPAANAAPGDKK